MSDVVEIVLPASPAVVDVVVPGSAAIVEVVERGLQGPPGAAADSYDHVQSSAATTWTVNHNLGRLPIVSLRSVGGVEIEGDVVHVSNNQAQITFNISTAGTARFN